MYFASSALYAALWRADALRCCCCSASGSSGVVVLAVVVWGLRTILGTGKEETEGPQASFASCRCHVQCRVRVSCLVKVGVLSQPSGLA